MTDLLDKKFEKDVLEAYEAELPKSKGIGYVVSSLIDEGTNLGTYDLTTIFDNIDFDSINEDVYEMLIDYIDYLVSPENIDETWRELCADYTSKDLMFYTNYEDDKIEIDTHYSAVENEHPEIDYDGFSPILKSLLKAMYVEADPKWFDELEAVYIDAIEKVFNKEVEKLEEYVN